MSLTIRPLRRGDVEGCLRVIASLPRFFAVSEGGPLGESMRADVAKEAAAKEAAERAAADETAKTDEPEKVGAHRSQSSGASRTPLRSTRPTSATHPASGVHPVRPRRGRHGMPDDEDEPAPGGRSIAQAARDLGTQGGLVAIGPGGDVLGFLTWKRHGDKAAEITWMAVHSALRHKGVGTTLLTRLERLLATQGFQNISAITSAFSHTYEPTRQFWRGRGYAPVLELEDLWETDVALVLTKSLEP
ncbi:GNAT family N-acetyltransferase [Cryptosporangium phraense]|uniref:GNAT family N-acetyltransferase n=1 Tax=Cryptosporangium phraense TaxID=2593070 RepID=A0A545AUH7_9ACTN|nr:GNAT family N-acetyltransferase [Cryptosporangium phraense]TQS44990.1 GNAT family N-acetyltransferase [Cryptosporangium phraense]